MNTEDVALARVVRHEFSRRPVDITRVDIQVNHGRVTLSGILLPLRDRPETNLESEVELVTKQLMRNRLVKEVTSSMRLKENEVKVEEVNARGRNRGSR